MKKYRVARKRVIVDAIVHALRSSGAELLAIPSPNQAPFEFEVRVPGGDRVSLVCYAFLANKYRQKGRPPDEHRFQIKYGSDFDHYHEIYLDPNRERITLFFGVHVEEGLFVAVDPALYNPTWFSTSVEFKSQELHQASQSGWHCCERERSFGRRKQVMPVPTNTTECVLAFRPENFVRFIHFERIATGLDVGERTLLAESMVANTRTAPGLHPLEEQFGMQASEILDLVWQGAFRLRAAMFGRVAEYHLERYLTSMTALSVTALDEDGKPDFEVVYKGRSSLIECKNVLRKLRRQGPKVDFQKTRASVHDRCTRFYDRNAFDILAACLHPVTMKWEFRFCLTNALVEHPDCPNKLSPHVFVGGDTWTTDLFELLD